MKVRSKLFLVMSVFICCMGAVFFIFANNYMGSLFRQYGQAARMGSADQVARLLSFYYQSHNDSWSGVDDYIHGLFEARNPADRGTLDRGIRPEYLVLLSPDNRVITTVEPHGWQVPPDASSLMQNGGVKVPIVSDGKTVATLWIRDRGVQILYSVQQRVLHTITLSTLWGVLVTAAIGLLIAAWFARRVTRPLKNMEKAIHSISDGDLSTRIPVESTDEFGTVAAALNDMANRLNRMEEARRQLVADVAHELRTPLTIIQGQLELFQQGVRRPEPGTLLPIYDEVLRLHRLVGELHELSLADVGKLPLDIASVDVVQLLARIVDNFQLEAEEQSIDLRLDIPESGEHVAVVDSNRITQVFVNLVGNALQYTPASGRVAVVLTWGDTDWSVTVSDSGPGISQEHLSSIFDRFYRAEHDRSRGTGGMGLGLAIAKEYVEAHGGHIDVESVMGEGTTFTVRLPRISHPA